MKNYKKNINIQLKNNYLYLDFSPTTPGKMREGGEIIRPPHDAVVAAAKAAGRLKAKTLAAELSQTVTDPDADVRAASRDALVGLKHPGALEASRAALDDPSSLVAGLADLGECGEATDLGRIQSLARTYRSTSIQARVFATLDRLEARKVVDSIYVDDKMKDYIVDHVCASRDPQNYNVPAKGLIHMGASPRATIYLTQTAKAHAFMQGRGYVTPQDVKSIAMDVLRHRVHITYEAEAEEKTSEDVVKLLLDHLPVP